MLGATGASASIHQRVMVHLPSRFSKFALYVPVVSVSSLSAVGTLEMRIKVLTSAVVVVCPMTSHVCPTT